MELEIIILSICIMCNITAYYFDLFSNHGNND